MERDYDFDYDEYDNGDCWNCGGEGFVSSCFTEYACLYPEAGCNQCTRRCEICNPAKLTPEQEAERDALRRLLARALSTQPKDTPHD